MVALDAVHDNEPEHQAWALAVLEAAGVVTTHSRPVIVSILYKDRCSWFRTSVSHAATVTRSSEKRPAQGSASGMSLGSRYWSGSGSVGWLHAVSTSAPTSGRVI
jgi:hypothetical protein